MGLLIIIILSTTTVMAGIGNMHDKNESEQGDILKNIVKSSGNVCDMDVKTFYHFGSDKLGYFWSIKCANGDMNNLYNTSYLVRIMDNGTSATTVLDCRTARKLDIYCFRK